MDPTYKDELGEPLIRVTVEYTDLDIKRAQHRVETCIEIMEEMGADLVEPVGVADDVTFEHKFFTNYFLGGVVMGYDSTISAVNTYSPMWDMENFFVLGGSSFPHNSSLDPTETIGAFAYRATEGMDKYLKNGGGLVVKEKNEYG